ncbi:polyamine transporter tpo5 [Elasticomyces elasticus]|nr:polyamine transporter tpo5 [Elasticomyces elasticus]
MEIHNEMKHKMGEPSELASPAPSIAHGKMSEVVAADDERLAQMGYNQVSGLDAHQESDQSYSKPGVQKGIYQALDIILCNLYYGSVRFCASNIRTTTPFWRSRDSYLDLVCREFPVHDYSSFRVVAELCSAYPTAGGMYFVTKFVVPQKHVPLASWIIGWANFTGQTAGVASVAYGTAQMLLAAVSMGSAYDLETQTFAYTPIAAHVVAVSIGLLLLMGIVCSLPTKWLSQFIKWFAPTNILATIAICIALLVTTKDKRSASDVFGHVTDGSGWNSKGFSFLLGFLSVAWTMTDYDATVHISEETKEAAIRGPVAIMQAVIISGIFGLLLNVTIGFCIRDIDAALASPFGNPVAQVLYDSQGRNAALAMWVWPVLIQFFTGCAAMLSDTRMAFSFARDEAIPFSRHVNTRTRTPLNSVWLVVIICSCLNLIALGNVQTISAIYNATAPALDCSYMAVVALKLWYEKELKPVKGPFNLGRWSKPVNYIALTWVSFISVVLIFPPISPVTAANMNYAICVLAFIATFALGWWYLGARR